MKVGDKKRIDSWSRDHLLFIGKDAVVRALPAAISRNTDVLRQLSSLIATVDDCPAEELKEALLDIARVCAHNNVMATKTMTTWALRGVCNVKGSEHDEDKTDSDTALSLQLASSPLVADYEKAKLAKLRLARIGTSEKPKGRPFFDSASVHAWPVHPTLSVHRFNPFAHMPAGYDGAEKASTAASSGSKHAYGGGTETPPTPPTPISSASARSHVNVPATPLSPASPLGAGGRGGKSRGGGRGGRRGGGSGGYSGAPGSARGGRGRGGGGRGRGSAKPAAAASST